MNVNNNVNNNTNGIIAMIYSIAMCIFFLNTSFPIFFLAKITISLYMHDNFYCGCFVDLCQQMPVYVRLEITFTIATLVMTCHNTLDKTFPRLPMQSRKYVRIQKKYTCEGGGYLYYLSILSYLLSNYSASSKMK